MEEKLSKMIVDYSLHIQNKDRVLVTYMDDSCKDLVKQLIDDITLSGGIPFVKRTDADIGAYLLEKMDQKMSKEIKKQSEFEVHSYDCFIHIRYTSNTYEDKRVPIQAKNLYGKVTGKSHDIKINQKRWILLNYPSLIDAYKAKMPYDQFYTYAMNAMTADYSAMWDDIKPLKELMEKTNKVRVTGKYTDITFSIKGIPVIPCLGNSNIPDGEIFTSPIKNTVNGTITYNTPSPYRGDIFNNVSLLFENGKIIKATCDENNEKLISIFDTDEGSHYVGEFSFGLNPHIMHPVGDILFDEKIIGSIHFTPGAAYKEAYNGNDSAIHFDMVLVQRKEYGGGNVYFDDVLIRKDGLFVLPELEPLNYGLS